ncbi:uncharacterized protein Z520_04861 [Fonsecaea multimorphosa CBS 102226]|uniref:Uncharacterized protein n=1 Tax=Fonsecaea multimorphosa CBS 102226 TaxID=1442371 RepID=A0A0D2HBL7_9EURO|nr:uncharacterized protein Z520_04861 [Fonsecaea multimorphosa CBS 102226]KIX99285.1 hypothetical protein Z520_04861 [Fonsecaea multimorphosa CBS 102226]OAL25975.1 hypothetical protein AYO22_04602 [Fonsecaea multimorphosa]
MPVRKWNDAEKLTLLRTAIACSPNFKLDANKVSEMWPGDDDNAKPTVRSVRDNFHSIMKHAQDLEALRQIKQGGAAAKDEDEDEDKNADHKAKSVFAVPSAPSATTSSMTKSSDSKNPVTTPRRGLTLMNKRSTANKSSTGSKRKGRAETPCSDDEMRSASETTSGDEVEVDTPTPLARKTLPVRKTRRAARAPSEDVLGGAAAEVVDEGAKQVDTEGSDGEYDLAKEREKKAARKAKLAKQAAKQAAKRARK